MIALYFRIDLYERGEGMNLNDNQEERSDDENAQPEPSLARREEEEKKEVWTSMWDPSPKG